MFCSMTIVLLLYNFHAINSDLRNYYHPDILEVGFLVDPSLAKINFTIHRIRVFDRLTNAISGVIELYQKLPCQAMVTVTTKVLVHNEYKIFDITRNTIWAGLHGFSSTSVGKAIENLKNCISPDFDCPFKPDTYTVTDCYVLPAVTQYQMTNRRNMTFSLSNNGTGTVGECWITTEMDDSARNRARKPTASQRNRRKNFSTKKP